MGAWEGEGEEGLVVEAGLDVDDIFVWLIDEGGHCYDILEDIIEVQSQKASISDLL